MSKLKRSDDQIRAATWSGTVKKYKEKMGLTTQQLAVKAHMSESSLYQKLREPEKFGYPEICSLCRVLKIPGEELLECFPVELQNDIKVQVVLDESFLAGIRREAV